MIQIKKLLHLALGPVDKPANIVLVTNDYQYGDCDAKKRARNVLAVKQGSALEKKRTCRIGGHVAQAAQDRSQRYISRYAEDDEPDQSGGKRCLPRDHGAHAQARGPRLTAAEPQPNGIYMTQYRGQATEYGQVKVHECVRAEFRAQQHGTQSRPEALEKIQSKDEESPTRPYCARDIRGADVATTNPLNVYTPGTRDQGAERNRSAQVGEQYECSGE